MNTIIQSSEVLSGWPTHLVVGILIFFVVNWIGKHSTHFGYDFLNSVSEPENAPGFNLIFRIFTPVVVLILISSALYAAGLDRETENIHYSIYYYIAIRVGFNSIIRQRGRLAPWRRMLFQWGATIFLGALAYKYVISEREYLFPDVKTLGNEIWLLLLGYVYILAKSFGNSDANRSVRVKSYILFKLKSFKRRYESSIKSIETNPALICLVYSIMVVEDFNRPAVYRAIERIMFRFGRAKTIGLMQVSTNRMLSDSESVTEAVRIIQLLFRQALLEDDWRVDPARVQRLSSEDIAAREEAAIVHKILVKYNPSGDYARDVESVFELVREISGCGNVRIHLYPERIFRDTGSEESMYIEGDSRTLNVALPTLVGGMQDERCVVYVTTGAEFVDAIASNRTILISSTQISLDNLPNIFRENVRLVEAFDGFSVAIHDVRNLRIAAEGEGYAKIVVSSRYASVLTFEDCHSISLERISFGHSPDGYCSGGVISVSGATDFRIRDCDLFGCGTQGVELIRVTKFEMEKSTIRDCTYGIMRIESSTDVGFVDVLFRNCGPYFGVDVNDCRNVEFANCCFVENTSEEDFFRVVSSSSITCTNGHFFRNCAKSFGVINLVDTNLVSRANSFRDLTDQ